jgi:hypothetical protein
MPGAGQCRSPPPLSCRGRSSDSRAAGSYPAGRGRESHRPHHSQHGSSTSQSVALIRRRLSVQIRPVLPFVSRRGRRSAEREDGEAPSLRGVTHAGALSGGGMGHSSNAARCKRAAEQSAPEVQLLPPGPVSLRIGVTATRPALTRQSQERHLDPQPPFRGVAQQQSTRLGAERPQVRALPSRPLSRRVAQPVRAPARHAGGLRCDAGRDDHGGQTVRGTGLA